MLTDDDVKWLLKNLPIEIIRHIIASYNPCCFFIMDWLSEYDWNLQCKLTFGFPGNICTYYILCQNLKTVGLSCGESNIVINRSDSVLYTRHQGAPSLVLEKGFPKDIINVICGSDHTIAMTSDRKLFGRGDNSYLQLGMVDKYKYVSTFTEIENVPFDIVQIGCGSDYTAILRENGVVMIMGRDFHLNMDHKFREMDLPKDVVKLACSTGHMLALRSDGTLMACGDNEYGQLGDDSCYYRSTFKKISDIPNDIIDIVCGGDYTIIMRANGTLMSCGNNRYGQLGHGDTLNRATFTEIKETKDIEQIACGDRHSIIVGKYGLMGCGDNTSGQLGLGDEKSRSKFTEIKNVDNVAQIACGDWHTVIMKIDGTVMGCGNNLEGQLGIKGVKRINKFEKITV